MGLLAKAIQNLKTGASCEPDAVELVSACLCRDRLLYENRLRVHQAEGLIRQDAQRAAAEDVLHDKPILRALYITGWRWETRVVPTGRGDHAWSWIHAHQEHSPSIRAAEADIDRIGTKGDPQEFQGACDAWVEVWRKAIEDWMQLGGNR